MARSSGAGGRHTRELVTDELVRCAHFLRDSQRLDTTRHPPIVCEVEKAFAGVELGNCTDKNGRTVRHKVLVLRPVECLAILMIQESGEKITRNVIRSTVEAIRSALLREKTILFFVHQQAGPYRATLVTRPARASTKAHPDRYWSR